MNAQQRITIETQPWSTVLPPWSGSRPITCIACLTGDAQDHSLDAGCLLTMARDR